MKVLVIGGGGREHAICWKLAKSPKVTELVCAPGNAGIAEVARCVDIGVMDFEKMADFAQKEAFDLVVVGPDDPLAAGIVDVLEEGGLRVFGPRKNAAILEGSKAFSKDLMKKYGIPTAAYETFDSPEAALAYLETAKIPVVLKADGLALGKGVLICNTREEAREGVKTLMMDKQFGHAGDRIVAEEFLTGREVSVLAFVDGKTFRVMTSAQDHKRAEDGDQGLSTGGMGSCAPSPFYTGGIDRFCRERIYQPTVDAMRAEGREFKGIIFFGLMLTGDGPKVIEYNCRFGDPETQVVLPLLEGSLLEIMLATAQGRLAEVDVRFADKSACCVILASQGYPGRYETGFPISLPETGANEHIYIAGAAVKDGALVTGGGRVLGATAVADDLPAAVEAAYALADRVHFDNAYCRRDIGRRALRALEGGR